METPLREILVKKDNSLLEEYISRMEGDQNFCLVSLIDELLPFLVMETNLRYGNFHQVKMNLFLRRLAGQGVISRKTQFILARLLIQEAINRDWVEVQGGFLRGGREVENPLPKMLEALGAKNIHNAFFYASHAYRQEPVELVQGLLWLSTASIPDTLGHSFSCFLPVMGDLVLPGHRAAPTSLFSYLMYLGRFPVPGDLPTPVKSAMLDLNSLLQTCASGEGIVNLHHMITLYLFLEWELTSFNRGRGLPFRILEEWVSEKTLDQERLERLEDMEIPAAPNTYEEFSERFDLDQMEATVNLVISILESGVPATDWLFRVFSGYYRPEIWNPHYFTGLYCALGFYKNMEIETLARRMAVAQAVEYFGEIRDKLA